MRRIGLFAFSRGRWKIFRLVEKQAVHELEWSRGGRLFARRIVVKKKKKEKKNMQIERRRPVFLGSERGKETFGNR